MACVVYYCKETKKIGGVSFYRFPVEPTLCKKWCEKIGKNFVPKSTARVCGKHFKSNCFERDSNGIMHLKNNAVPTVTDVLSPVETKVVPKSSKTVSNAVQEEPTSLSPRRQSLRNEKRLRSETSTSKKNKKARVMEIKSVPSSTKRSLREKLNRTSESSSSTIEENIVAQCKSYEKMELNSMDHASSKIESISTRQDRASTSKKMDLNPTGKADDTSSKIETILTPQEDRLNSSENMELPSTDKEDDTSSKYTTSSTTQDRASTTENMDLNSTGEDVTSSKIDTNSTQQEDRLSTSENIETDNEGDTPSKLKSVLTPHDSSENNHLKSTDKEDHPSSKMESILTPQDSSSLCKNLITFVNDVFLENGSLLQISLMECQASKVKIERSDTADCLEAVPSNFIIENCTVKLQISKKFQEFIFANLSSHRKEGLPTAESVESANDVDSVQVQIPHDKYLDSKVESISPSQIGSDANVNTDSTIELQTPDRKEHNLNVIRTSSEERPENEPCASLLENSNLQQQVSDDDTIVESIYEQERHENVISSESNSSLKISNLQMQNSVLMDEDTIVEMNEEIIVETDEDTIVQSTLLSQESCFCDENNELLPFPDSTASAISSIPDSIVSEISVLKDTAEHSNVENISIPTESSSVKQEPSSPSEVIPQLIVDENRPCFSGHGSIQEPFIEAPFFIDANSALEAYFAKEKEEEPDSRTGEEDSESEMTWILPEPPQIKAEDSLPASPARNMNFNFDMDDFTPRESQPVHAPANIVTLEALSAALSNATENCDVNLRAKSIIAAKRDKDILKLSRLSRSLCSENRKSLLKRLENADTPAALRQLCDTTKKRISSTEENFALVKSVMHQMNEKVKELYVSSEELSKEKKNSEDCKMLPELSEN